MDDSFTEQLKRFEYGPGKRRLRSQASPSKVPKVTKVASPKSSTPSKRKGQYAPPEKYAHLDHLPTLLKPGLKCVFVGFNPGVESATRGHYYAHHTNLFWKLMSESGCAGRQVTCQDDRLLPDECGIGFTDLVSRPTTGINELAREEMDESVKELERKIAGCEPQMICLIGKGIWDSIYKQHNGKAQRRKDFDWGLQGGVTVGGCSSVFVLPSTSGLVAGVSRAEKLRLWKLVAKHLHGL